MTGTTTTFAVAGIALVAGIAAGWWFGATWSGRITAEETKRRLAAEEERTSLASNVAELSPKLKLAESRAGSAERRLSEAETRAADLQRQLDAKTAEVERLAAEAKRPAPVAAKSGPRKPKFAFAQFGKLDEVDWGQVGEHLSAMAPLCNDIMAKMKKGDEMPGEELGKLQGHNGPLVAAALKVTRDVPGTGPNGSFTHPAFMVNAIAATLEAAGDPLTDAEATALEKLARDFSAEDVARLAGYDERVYTLQKTSDEADLRRRFVDAAFAVLTEHQRDTLTPPAVKGVVGFDLFSDGLLWATVMRPLPFKEKDAEALVTQVAGVLDSGLKLPVERHEAARAVISGWVHELPPTLLDDSDDPNAAVGRDVVAVRECARQTLALVQRLARDLKLDAEQADAARGWRVVLVPAPQKAN